MGLPMGMVASSALGGSGGGAGVLSWSVDLVVLKADVEVEHSSFPAKLIWGR